MRNPLVFSSSSRGSALRVVLFPRILNSDDVEVFTRREIEQVHVSFYSRLFLEDFIYEACKERCLSGIKLTLSSKQLDSCEGPLSLTELSNALKSLNLNHSPGLDGLTVEFYLHLSDVLALLLLRVARECFLRGSLPDSMKGSVTRLIFKKKCLKNWRPTSLLNVDYKIFPKVITSCLSKVPSFIIHPDQTCSIPGRSSFCNVTLLRDTLDYIERRNETAILVSLDQEKAFDRVNRSFLLDLLVAVGFGPHFYRWIAIFYNGVHMRIVLNNWLTEQISLERDVRQGDRLSPLLYVLCIEVLANLLRGSPRIKGFLSPGSGGLQANVRLYDTTLLLKGSRSLASLFESIDIFEKRTGAKLNRSSRVRLRPFYHIIGLLLLAPFFIAHCFLNCARVKRVRDYIFSLTLFLVEHSI